jgi:uncharacterized protein YdeI (YjbR/CyaY-like superfamily)
MTALKRVRHPMPEDVKQALESSELMGAYRSRPDYQQNDYVGWIEESRREVTRRKRIRQMLEELEAGDVYMKMAWKPSGGR